ncbi:unnamed protein product, partial [Polarella glacialis]
DGVAILWRRRRLDEALKRHVFLELEKGRRTKAAQVALLQRLRLSSDEAGMGGRGIVVCSTHLRASADDAFRMQQASEVVSALSDFARGDEQIVLADVNSFATLNSATGGNATNVYDYFTACGYRCAYRAVGKDSNIPSYTTWAGWASGDFRATCDHIFVSKGIHVSAVLDVPSSESLADAFPERLPNRAYPSDHMSLIADLVIT